MSDQLSKTEAANAMLASIREMTSSGSSPSELQVATQAASAFALLAINETLESIITALENIENRLSQNHQ